MKSRHLVPEWMDDPKLDAAAHRQALNGLRRINRLSGTARTIANSIRQYLSKQELMEATILDLGCGSGDVAYGVAKRLSVQGNWRIEGWDMSPTAVDFARQLHGNDVVLSLAQEKPSKRTSECDPKVLVSNRETKCQSTLSFHQRNVFQSESVHFDFVYCSLFLHHFSDSEAILVLRRMREIATRRVIIDDLERSQFGYWIARMGVQILSRSPVVHFDGPQSVRAAFTTAEVTVLARAAGFTNVTVHRRFPARWLLTAEVER